MVFVPDANQSRSNGSQSALSARSWRAQHLMGEKRDPLVAAAMKDQARLIQRMRAANSRIRRIPPRKNGQLGAKLVNVAVAYGLRPSHSMSHAFEHSNKVFAILQALQELSGNNFSYKSFKKKIKKADAKSRSVPRRRSPVATRQRTKRQ